MLEVVIGVVVERRTGGVQVLIARRPEEAILGGYWEFPGGKLQPGERRGDCLIREFEEELNLTVSVIGVLPSIRHAYDHGLVCLYPFYCRREAGELRALRVSDYRWVNPDDLHQYRFPPANGPLLERVREDMNRLGALRDRLDDDPNAKC